MRAAGAVQVAPGGQNVTEIIEVWAGVGVIGAQAGLEPELSSPAYWLTDRFARVSWYRGGTDARPSRPEVRKKLAYGSDRGRRALVIQVPGRGGLDGHRETR
jgi:hypothetical protein